jgi:hypothetical protein
MTQCLHFIRHRHGGENSVEYLHSSLVSNNSLMLLMIGPFCSCIISCFPRRIATTFTASNLRAATHQLHQDKHQDIRQKT